LLKSGEPAAAVSISRPAAAAAAVADLLLLLICCVVAQVIAINQDDLGVAGDIIFKVGGVAHTSHACL
jgi:hypothetical protein